MLSATRSQKRRKLTRGGVASEPSRLPLAVKFPQLPSDPLPGPVRGLSPARIHGTYSGVVCKQRVSRKRVAAGRGPGWQVQAWGISADLKLVCTE